MKFDVVLKQFKCNTLILLFSEIYEPKEITVVLLKVSKHFDVDMHWNVSETSLVQMLKHDDNIKLLNCTF